MSKIHVSLSFILGLVFNWTTLLAQNPSQILDVGDELFEQKDYFGSIQIYEQALNIDSSDFITLYKYALNLKMLNNHKKASRYFLKAYLIDKDNTYPELSYLLAESYRNSAYYRKAKRYYSRAIRPFRREKNSYEYQRITQSKKALSWASTKGKKRLDYQVENLENLNSSFSEFSGTLKDDHIYFTALIADSSGENNVIFDQDFYAKIYSSFEKKTQIVTFSESNKFDKKHLSNLSFGPENQVFFSVCDTNFICEIWTGKFDKGQIKKTEKLNQNINQSKSNNTQAQIVTIDNFEYLFFVSDRERGFGGLDIWVSKKESFGFDKAINLGSSINSLDNEISPIYNPKNQTLYFSSDWHSGLGGYDIFKSKGGPFKFEKTENLLMPINSEADEYYFFPKKETALFSSNRRIGNTENSGNCCNDLFKVNYIEDEYIELDPEKIEVTVEVLNKYLPLDLYFGNDSPDPNTRETTTEKSYDQLAKKYMLSQSQYEKEFSSQLADSSKEDGIIEIQDFFSEHVSEGYKSLEFFTPLLIKELKKGSQIELTIKGYASSLSASDYNLNLTLRRIQSLINYFKNYDSGVLAPYLNQTATNKGSLIINKLPYGEFAVEGESFDNNKTLAIYSPEAAKQRKIELLAVTVSDKGRENFDGSLKTGEAKIELESTGIELNKNIKENNYSFDITNDGNAELKIYTINANCDCIQVKYPKTLGINKSAKIQFTLDFEMIKNEANIVLSIFSNTTPNINNYNIHIK